LFNEIITMSSSTIDRVHQL